MPTLFDLVNGDKNFNYYTGKGNFTQKSIPFGKDRPGGGSSGQPYVTTSPNDAKDNIGIINTLQEAARDVTRVTRFLADFPKGPKFIAKQVGLQLMNPKMESVVSNVDNNYLFGDTTFKRGVNSTIGVFNRVKNELGPTRIYNPLCTNLLAQVAGSFIGEHFVRAGMSLNMDDHDKYTYIADTNNRENNNRLVNILRGMSFGNVAALPSLKKGDLYLTNKELFSYVGGGNSTYGVGRTSIKSYGSTFAAIKSPQALSAKVTSIPYSDIIQIGSVNADMLGSNTDAILNNASVPSQNTFNFKTQDFRAYKRALDPDNYPAYTQNKESKFAAARSGMRIDLDTNKNANSNNVFNRLGVINTNNKDGYAVQYEDRINALSLYYGEGPIGLDSVDMNKIPVNAERVRDLIKFRIKALDNDNKNMGTFMVFRAFLHSNPTDNTTATWNAIKYVGRGESFYSYDGVENQMSVGFTVVAFSRQEMMPLYQKLNYLKSTMYPDYTTSGKMRGTIHEITIGDYIKYQPCVITSLSISIPEDTTWEIALNSPDPTINDLDKDMHELPMMLKVSLEFTPIWKFLPRKGTTNGTGVFITPPFIGIDNEQGSKRDNEWARNTKEPFLTTQKISSNSTQGKK